eukprot:TRINITY_DN68348_c0_g1_i1.p1 TRINITY_DN68348_c0_g1~~TRINITY_DN68348_c0_g1_i1.p1  ORF type:complete len:203 (-),score=23.70 TRINITY_DN68348_c0_g1_i1:174-722(-)
MTSTEENNTTSTNNTATPTNDIRSKLHYIDIGERQLELLRTLNAVTFPVQYQEQFYQQVLHSPVEYNFLVNLTDITVGAVCCRVEKINPDDKSDQNLKLYIMTFGVLAAYRQLKIGSAMLDRIIAAASKNSHIQEVHLHVQINNDVAVKFYQKFGFELKDTLKGYYKRIEPADAHHLVKKLR